MLLTILLALAGMVLLCLMIAAATYFMPFRGMAGFFPPDMKRVRHLSEATLNKVAAQIGESFWDYPYAEGEAV